MHPLVGLGWAQFENTTRVLGMTTIPQQVYNSTEFRQPSYRYGQVAPDQAGFKALLAEYC